MNNCRHVVSRVSYFQYYLKSLSKKQKEVQKKYVRSGSVASIGKGSHKDDDDGGSTANVTEDDSDLDSLAREFAKEEIQDSPFLKRRTGSTVSGGGGAGSRRQSLAATPLPEQDAPFINSLVNGRNKAKKTMQQSSTALQSFMKFDKKYVVRGNNLAADKIESETEPEISEETAVSPRLSQLSKTLEGKVRSRRSSSVASMASSRREGRRASNIAADISSAATKLSRIQQKAKGKHLKLTMPNSQSPITPRKESGAESAAFTASEMSELPTGSPSPILELNVMGIEELELPEIEEEEQTMEKEAEQTEITPRSPTVKHPSVIKEEDEEEEVKEDDSDEDTLKKEPAKGELEVKQEPTKPKPDNSSMNVKVKKDKETYDKNKFQTKEKEKKKSNKHKSKRRELESESEQSESFTTSTSTTSSTPPPPPPRHRHHRDRHSHRRKHGHGPDHRQHQHNDYNPPTFATSSKRCYYCRQLCDYHKDRVIPAQRDNISIQQDESVQVGATHPHNGSDHYLIDPTGDILYNAWSASNNRPAGKFAIFRFMVLSAACITTHISNFPFRCGNSQ
jgi:hypothetical protein